MAQVVPTPDAPAAASSVAPPTPPAPPAPSVAPPTSPPAPPARPAPTVGELERKEREASERRANLKPHVAAAQEQMRQQAVNARQYLKKIKGRLDDGTFTEDELAELQTQLPVDEAAERADANKASVQPEDRPLRPSEIGAPRPEMQKAQDKVERRIANCMRLIDRLDDRLASGMLSDDETMEGRTGYQDMLNKLERLASGRNPGAA